MFSLYQLPKLSLPEKEPVLSFGMAGELKCPQALKQKMMCPLSEVRLLVLCQTGPGTGVPFHVHGPTYAETIYGRKARTHPPTPPAKIHRFLCYSRGGFCTHQPTRQSFIQTRQLFIGSLTPTPLSLSTKDPWSAPCTLERSVKPLP